MEKFKVGDRVRQIKNLDMGESELATIIKIKGDTIFHKHDGQDYKEYNAPSDNFILATQYSSPYSSLKSRIEAINENTTVKEWDDILVNFKAFDLTMNFRDNPSEGFVRPYHNGAEENFYFNSNCEKGQAHKEALLWLLDHSDIKKDDNQEKIEKLQKSIDELTQRGNELKEGLSKAMAELKELL